MNIEGLRIIITGAGAGFGQAVTRSLAESGARIAAFDINSGALDALVRDIPSVFPVVCDVSDNTQVEKSVEEAFSGLGGIDVLINNAGIMKNAPLINLLQRPDRKHSLDLWHQVISVNQNSVFYMTRSVVDRMIGARIKGVLINISSISARGNIGQTAYSASKAAVAAMSRVWAKELGSFGIRSVAIAPGFMDTAGTAAAIEEKMLNRWIEQTPLRRTGKIEEVVSTIRFAIENDFINGETLHINGGLSL